uniref:Uncharacterized protein n=1 Tax=Cyclopterus lumpus TaxID=8103 RepID=A0A8C3AL30_CYCLU
MNMLPPSAFVPLLACLLPLMSATVVQDFNHIERCKDSLYMGTPPQTSLRGTLRFLDEECLTNRMHYYYYYVTLYDPQKRIPVYSVYTFKKTEGDRRVYYPLMYEPQLAEVDGDGNMHAFSTGYLHNKFEDSQAVLNDYSDVVLYERGHLNPDQHQSTPHDRAATYTLTNVVPEMPDPHPPQQLLPRHGPHRDRCDHQRQHDPQEQPGPRRHPRRTCGPRTAAQSTTVTHDVRIRFPSYGVLAKNAKEGNSVHEMRVQELEIFLKNNLDVDQNHQLFYDNCISPSPLPLYLQHTI